MAIYEYHIQTVNGENGSATQNSFLVDFRAIPPEGVVGASKQLVHTRGHQGVVSWVEKTPKGIQVTQIPERGQHNATLLCPNGDGPVQFHPDGDIIITAYLKSE